LAATFSSRSRADPSPARRGGAHRSLERPAVESGRGRGKRADTLRVSARYRENPV